LKKHTVQAAVSRTAIMSILSTGLLTSRTSNSSATGTSSQTTSSSASPAITPPALSQTSPTSPQTGSATTAQAINPAAIPIGDGHVSSAPEVGYVDSCVTNFRRQPNADGPWINATAGTWYSLTKPSSAGSVSWPSAQYTVTESGNTRTIVADGLPIDHPTGVFPVTSADPTFQWDHNPNKIVAQPTTINLPLNPSAAPSPSCVGMGPIGILTGGVLLFNALGAAGVDGGAHEAFDQWGEHPDGPDQLHHHFVPSFMPDAVSLALGASTLVGYAAEGYGIYVEYTASRQLVTNADLDACHWTTSPVLWNGEVQSVYHDDATVEYPCTAGCYHGTPNSSFTVGHSAQPTR